MVRALHLHLLSYAQASHNLSFSPTKNKNMLKPNSKAPVHLRGLTFHEVEVPIPLPSPSYLAVSPTETDMSLEGQKPHPLIHGLCGEVHTAPYFDNNFIGNDATIKYAMPGSWFTHEDSSSSTSTEN